MLIEKFNIEGPLLITPRIFPDDRGYFFESYNEQLFQSQGLTARVMELVEQGHSDKQIAQQLTAQGCRSPRKDYLCPATVGVLRRRQGKLRGTSRGGRIKVGGALTVGDLAQLLGVHRQWIYSLIYRGVIKLDRDDEYGMYLFPRDPEVLKQLRQLRAGLIHNIVLSKEHQDA